MLKLSCLTSREIAATTHGNNKSQPIPFLWSILIHIICHKHEAETNLLFLALKPQAHRQKTLQMAWNLRISVSIRRHQVNSSSWPHGEINSDPDWLNGKLSARMCYDFITEIVVFSRTQLSKSKQFFHSLSIPPPHSSRLNYITFINLASSVSRRSEERQRRSSRSIVFAEEDEERSCGWKLIKIKQHESLSVSQPDFPPVLEMCYYVLLCIVGSLSFLLASFFGGRMGRKKEKIIFPSINSVCGRT